MGAVVETARAVAVHTVDWLVFAKKIAPEDHPWFRFALGSLSFALLAAT